MAAREPGSDHAPGRVRKGRSHPATAPLVRRRGQHRGARIFDVRQPRSARARPPGLAATTLTPVTTRTYYWDFFGPRAEGTATHFVSHLREFLSKHELTGCTVDTVSEGDGHHAARC